MLLLDSQAGRRRGTMASTAEGVLTVEEAGFSRLLHRPGEEEMLVMKIAKAVMKNAGTTVRLLLAERAEVVGLLLVGLDGGGLSATTRSTKTKEGPPPHVSCLTQRRCISMLGPVSTRGLIL